MKLEKIFGQAEKVVEEKKLEVITTDESVLDDLFAYFERTKKTAYTEFDSLEEYFEKSLDFLKSYPTIKPETISKFNDKVDTDKLNFQEDTCLGIFLSSLIQTTYNQGFKDFKFKQIKADYFGAYLQGKKESPIKIKVECIEGDYNLVLAKNCFLEAETVYGWNSLISSNGCHFEVQNFNGRGYKHFKW